MYSLCVLVNKSISLSTKFWVFHSTIYDIVSAKYKTEESQYVIWCERDQSYPKQAKTQTYKIYQGMNLCVEIWTLLKLSGKSIVWKNKGIRSGHVIPSKGNVFDNDGTDENHPLFLVVKFISSRAPSCFQYFSKLYQQINNVVLVKESSTTKQI